jgi:hypothetical protein
LPLTRLRAVCLCAVMLEIVTHYVEHPVPVEPPAEPPPPPPQPLPLTKRERKKLRTQRRLAAEKERQDQIRCGLMPPPPPKVKISNLMQAMKDDAVADPSAMEAKVRAEMAQRIQNHEMRNQARPPHARAAPAPPWPCCTAPAWLRRGHLHPVWDRPPAPSHLTAPRPYADRSAPPLMLVHPSPLHGHARATPPPTFWQARKLTPEQRKDKKRRKMLNDPSGGGVPVTLYRIAEIPSKQKLYKIDINAQQNRTPPAARTPARAPDGRRARLRTSRRRSRAAAPARSAQTSPGSRCWWRTFASWSSRAGPRRRSGTASC